MTSVEKAIALLWEMQCGYPATFHAFRMDEVLALLLEAEKVKP